MRPQNAWGSIKRHNRIFGVQEEARENEAHQKNYLKK